MQAYFTVVDYVVFIGMLVVSMGIGAFHSRNNQTNEDYLLGGRGMSAIPVGISLLSSFISALSLLGYSGEAYAHGTQMFSAIIGVSIGISIAMWISLPVIFPLKLTSINEYLELRFHSRKLRTMSLVVNTLFSFLYMGLCLYAPTTALASVTPIDSNTYIIVLGIVCTIYSSIGGVKAVVWTDVFQMAVIVIGIISVIIIGSIEAGGISNVWAIANERGRIQFFDTNVDIYQRHNLLNVILLGAGLWGNAYSVSQTNLQRVCSVSTIQEARTTLWINIIGTFFIWVVIFLSGLAAFSVYANCDPISQGLIDTKEQILPYFVIDKMGFLWGVPGLFVASLFSGSLSSLSSVVNSMVACIWADFLHPMPFFYRMSELQQTRVNKCLSLLTGAVMIGFAFLASTLGEILTIGLSIGGATAGPMLGIFLLGVLVPHCNYRGAWAGFTVSWVLMSWIAIGGFKFKPPPATLSMSTTGCPANMTNNTEVLSTVGMDMIADLTLMNLTQTVEFNNDTVLNQEIEEWGLMSMYNISYALYSSFGLFTCMAVAILVTLLPGGHDTTNVSPELVHPWVRKLLKNRKEIYHGTEMTQYSPIAASMAKDSQRKQQYTKGGYYPD
ncbi:unnamed protein product [Meganyctiphanes norvegica]|uniref:Sodium-coupled monocarboxylate transporter 1 n=2 Tax=Meganyctiphanes norvegica TaxID=48144 RepID=A0AAV2RNR1_MEGNR